MWTCSRTPNTTHNFKKTVNKDLPKQSLDTEGNVERRASSDFAPFRIWLTVLCWGTVTIWFTSERTSVLVPSCMRERMCFVECIHFGTFCMCAVDYTSGALLANVEEVLRLRVASYIFTNPTFLFTALS